ncbi:MAG: hypothetical protein IJV54_12310 [Bacteroidales bacterium]|nr:hypothetical protein [Bacteroidales bacterium]
MFGSHRLKKELKEIQKKLNSSNKSINDLGDYIRKIQPIAIEEELISYCRVFGERIPIKAPDSSYGEEYFENAILFKEPVVLEHRTPLLGICYNPQYDTSNEFGKANLLKGRHLGLEGIISLSYLCGDEAEYQPWEKFGPIILNQFHSQLRIPTADIQ